MRACPRGICRSNPLREYSREHTLKVTDLQSVCYCIVTLGIIRAVQKLFRGVAASCRQNGRDLFVQSVQVSETFTKLSRVHETFTKLCPRNFRGRPIACGAPELNPLLRDRTCGCLVSSGDVAKRQKRGRTQPTSHPCLPTTTQHESAPAVRRSQPVRSPRRRRARKQATCPATRESS